MSAPQQADTLRTARKAAGLTQAEAAELLHAGLRTYHRWERGEQEMPAAERELFAMKLRDLYGVDLVITGRPGQES